jgi:predicted acetyltransferase
MNFRPYDSKKDRDAIHRVWNEIRWTDNDEEGDTKFLDLLLSKSKSLVADVNDQAECLVSSVPGSISHLESKFSLGVIVAVTTSLLARKLGLASTVTAQMVAQDAEAGMEISTLGMFEQGFYSRLGFGTGPYERKVKFNPAHINVPLAAGVPIRLTADDYEDVHNAMLKRWNNHGAVQLLPSWLVQAEMLFTEKPCGFGFRNDEGELTHFIWGEMKDEYGPLKINALAYRDRQQLLELFALIRNFGDQVYIARVIEPFHVQLQDLINEPFKNQNISEGNSYSESNNAEAFWQIRINDLNAVLSNTKLPGRNRLSFNLRLSDPIVEFLPQNQAWHGIGGDYTIELGENCSAASGFSDDLPLLDASVGGFSRLWLGCASATAIATSGEISGPQPLLDDLERCLSLPLPKPGWDF